MTMPKNAQNIEVISKQVNFSFSQKYPRRAVVNGFELNITKNILRGMYFIAVVNEANPVVPIRHLVQSVIDSFFGIQGKNCWSCDFTSNEEDMRLKSDLRKENSIAFTPLFVSKSLVRAYNTV